MRELRADNIAPQMGDDAGNAGTHAFGMAIELPSPMHHVSDGLVHFRFGSACARIAVHAVCDHFGAGVFHAPEYCRLRRRRAKAQNRSRNEIDSGLGFQPLFRVGQRRVFLRDMACACFLQHLSQIIDPIACYRENYPREPI